MFNKLLSGLKLFDWYFVINIMLLMIFGLAVLYSLQINVTAPNLVFFNRQLIFAALGLGLFFLFSWLNYQFWSDYYKFIFIASILVLLGVLLFGVSLRGTTGWLEFFGQTFQPVEFAKVALIIFLAKFFALKARTNVLLKNIVLAALAAGLLAVLVVLQPDFGSAAILFLTWLTLIFLLPVRREILLAILVLMVILALIFWAFILKDYQKERIVTFISPTSDPLGSGYNVRQSMVAVGSGHLWGRGLGLGSQSQLNFLPEQQADFIFAVISEELGFVGAGLTLLLFLSLIFRIYKIARETTDNFAQLFAFGVMIFLMVQIFINIGMNLGIAPVMGVPLPLVSYGGSSLLSVLLALAIVHSIHLRNRSSLFRRAERG